MAHHVFNVAHGEESAIGYGNGGRQRLRPVDRVETAIEQDFVCVHKTPESNENTAPPAGGGGAISIKSQWPSLALNMDLA
jgi:hypothetical protein